MEKTIKNFSFDMSSMRLLSLTIMLAVIMPFITNAQAGKVNFAGTWALNEAKSTLGDGGGQRMGGGNFVATQEPNLLTVVRTRTNQQGEAVTTTSKYTLDGKESINTTGRGESKSVATWSADGKTLSIETAMTFNMNGESRTMKMSESWALTDPKVLSIQSSFTGPNGEVKSTRVYDKK